LDGPRSFGPPKRRFAAPSGSSNKPRGRAKREGIPRALRFPSQAKIAKRADFQKTYDQGQKIVLPELVLYWRARDTKEGPGLKIPNTRFGVCVSSKIGCAVVRNRVKRILREAIRHIRTTVPSGFDVVVNSRNAAKDLSAAATEKLLRAAFTQAKLVKPPAAPMPAFRRPAPTAGGYPSSQRPSSYRPMPPRRPAYESNEAPRPDAPPYRGESHGGPRRPPRHDRPGYHPPQAASGDPRDRYASRVREDDASPAYLRERSPAPPAGFEPLGGDPFLGAATRRPSRDASPSERAPIERVTRPASRPDRDEATQPVRPAGQTPSIRPSPGIRPRIAPTIRPTVAREDAAPPAPPRRIREND